MTQRQTEFGLNRKTPNNRSYTTRSISEAKSGVPKSRNSE